MDIRAAGGSLAITGMAGLAKLTAQGVTAGTSDGSMSDIFTSMGVFGAALGIAYFMLRRGDRREREMLDAATREMEQMRHDLIAVQRHSETITDKYIEALVEIGALKAEAHLRRKDDER